MKHHRSWEDIVAALPPTDPVTRAEARRLRRARVAAYELRVVRRGASLTQKTVAARMGVGQPRVSHIEAGDVESVEVGTLRAYAEALGGELEIVATVNGKRYVVG